MLLWLGISNIWILWTLETTYMVWKQTKLLEYYGYFVVWWAAVIWLNHHILERGKNVLYQKNITHQTPQHSGTNFEPHIQNNSPSLVSFHGFCGYEFWLVVLGNCRTPHFQKLIQICAYVNSHVWQSFFQTRMVDVIDR